MTVQWFYLLMPFPVTMLWDAVSITVTVIKEGQENFPESGGASNESEI